MTKRNPPPTGNYKVTLGRLHRLAWTLEHIGAEGWNSPPEIKVKTFGVQSPSGDREASRILNELIRDVDRAVDKARSKIERTEHRHSSHPTSVLPGISWRAPKYRAECPECGTSVAAWAPLEIKPEG